MASLVGDWCLLRCAISIVDGGHRVLYGVRVRVWHIMNG